MSATNLQQLSKKMVKRGFKQNTDDFPSLEKMKKEITIWQEFAKKHELWGQDGWFLPEDKEYNIVLPYIEPNDIVLDIGAGNLAFDLLLAEKCKKVYAVELNPEVLGDALKTIRYDLPRNLIAICANGVDFPVPKDVTCLVMLLRHFMRKMPDEWLAIPKRICFAYEKWDIQISHAQEIKEVKP